MYTPQAGIFALGTSSHAYLEFDVLDPAKRRQFASTIAAIHEQRTTADVEGFDKAQRKEGFVMPSTQHDALVLLSDSAVQ